MINNFADFISLISDLAVGLKNNDAVLCSDLKCHLPTEGKKPLSQSEFEKFSTDIQQFILKNRDQLLAVGDPEKKSIKKVIKQLNKRCFDEEHNLLNYEAYQVLEETETIYKRLFDSTQNIAPRYASLDPLWRAVVRGDTAGVRALLNDHDSANFTYNDGTTLLEAYIKATYQHPNPEMLGLLLTHGGLIISETETSQVNFALLRLLGRKNTEELSLLVDQLKNASYSRDQMKCVSQTIFYANDFHFLNLCIDRNVPLAFDEHSNPYLELYERNQIDLLTKLNASSIAPKELLKSAAGFFHTPLVAAVRENNMPYCELLVAFGVKLEDLTLDDWMYIYRTAPEIYRKLISIMGVKIKDIKNSKDENLLHLLVKESPKDQSQWLNDITELVNLGVSPIQEETFKETPLKYAKNYQLWAVCKIFVTKLGNDPENTPLHIAILENNENAIKENLRYAYTNNSSGKKPFDLLVENNRKNLLPFFIESFDFKNYLQHISKMAFFNALKCHHYELANEIYNLNYTVEDAEKQECSVLVNNDPEAFKAFHAITSNPPKLFQFFEACRTNDLPTVKKVLIESPVFRKAFYDRTCALGISIANDAVDVAEYLIQSNADIYGLFTEETHSPVAGEVPLLDAIKKRSTRILDLILQQHQELPPFDLLIQNKDQIPSEKSKTYLLFSAILDHLIKQKDFDGILMLAGHPKTSETVKREGIARAIYGDWEDIIDKMIQQGFEIDGIWVRNFEEGFTPINAAINRGKVKTIDDLIKRGARLNVPFVNGFHLPSPLVIALTDATKHAEVIEYILDLYDQRKLPIPWDIVSQTFREFPKNNGVLIRYLKAKSTLNENDIKTVAASLYRVLFDQKLNITYSLMAVVSYGCTYLKSLEEWVDHINDVEKFAMTITQKVTPPQAKGFAQLMGMFKNAESEVSKIITQVYFHILCGMNPKMIKEHNCIQRIATLVLKTDLTYHDALLLALQTCGSLREVELGINYFIVKKKLGKGPPPALFKLSGNITPEQHKLLISEKDPSKLRSALEKDERFKLFHEKDYQELGEFLSVRQIDNIHEELQGWLNYFALYRDRTGLILCHRILKYQKSDTVLIKQALAALERVGIQRWDQKLENAQIQEITAIIKTSRDLDVKIQACKTLWALSRNEDKEVMKELFLEELKQLEPNATNKSNITFLIELLGNFNFTTTTVGREVSKTLRTYLKSSDLDTAFNAGISISKTDDKDGLLECLNVIDGPAWDRYAKDEARSASHIAGSFLTFRHKPNGLHENRSALRLRILDRLAKLEMANSEFVFEVDKVMHLHSADPSSQPYLQIFIEHFKSIPRTCTRFVGMPLYFPSGTAIGRGLSPRKGDESFFSSIQDLIREGCGTTDLTLETAIVEGSTWSRIGHIFGSHNSKLFFDHEGTYFQGENSAFLVIASDYYNDEYMRGDGRLECENTFNTVWYRGVPKRYLQAVFLEKANQKDIAALAGQDPIAGIKGNLTSPIFKDMTVKELVHIRRHLQTKDMVNVKGKITPLSLAERIHYYDSSKQPILDAAAVEKLGLKFPTEDDLLAESLRRAAARELVKMKYLKKT